MSDPIFLRNLINNTVYAEQIHTAQQSAQEATREKNIRVQQQKIKDQALAVDKLDESESLAVKEEGNQRKNHPDQEEREAQGDQAPDDKDSDPTQTDRRRGIQRIDITI